MEKSQTRQGSAPGRAKTRGRSSRRRDPRGRRQTSSNAPLADAIGHARALIDSYGRMGALRIAQANMVLISSARQYWRDVLLSIFRKGFPPEEAASEEKS